MTDLGHEPGKMGRAVGRLRPYGPIEIEGSVADAKAESGWIDEGTEIVVVRRTSFAVVVKAYEADSDVARDATSEHERRSAVASPIPVDGLSFWLERVNMTLVGALGWTAIGLLIVAFGGGVNIELLILPLGGGVAGKVFGYFVRGTRNLEAAYSDHRPKAYYFALCMLTGAVVAVAAALSLNAGAVVLTLALVAGTFAAGLVALGTQML